MAGGSLPFGGLPWCTGRVSGSCVSSRRLREERGCFTKKQAWCHGAARRTSLKSFENRVVFSKQDRSKGNELLIVPPRRLILSTQCVSAYDSTVRRERPYLATALKRTHNLWCVTRLTNPGPRRILIRRRANRPTNEKHPASRAQPATPRARLHQPRHAERLRGGASVGIGAYR